MPEPLIVASSSRRHSPCIGVCKLDEATGECLGCSRTGSEIAQWSLMTEAERDSVWALLPERATANSHSVRLLPWTAMDIGTWVVETMTGGRGTWVTGAPGAIAEFPCTPARPMQVEFDGQVILARASDAAMRLRLSDKLRAFSFTQAGPIVLGLPRARAAMPVAASLLELGPDADAVDEAQRPAILFDLGVDRAVWRFCVRSSDPDLTLALRRLVGRHWSDVMYEAGMKILAVGPNRVVESALARIEVFAPIPLPGEQSPPGAHTHFLPAFLKTGDEIPPSLALPDYAAPIAVFYPGGGLA